MGDNFDDIADLIIPHEVLEVGGKRFRLLGLGFPEVLFIVRKHIDALAPLYDAATAGDVQANVTAIAAHLADEFGPIAASVIACGMRKPDAAEKLLSLPFDKQAEALDKIARLTISDGGLGKLQEIVTRAAEVLSQANLQLPKR